MPRFNKFADWGSGVGGAVACIVNGREVGQPPETVGVNDWLRYDGDEVVSTEMTSFSEFKLLAVNKSGARRVLYHGRHDNAKVGGGRFTVLPHQQGWQWDDGTPIPLPVEALGRDDGCLVTWATHAGGLVIAGTQVASSDVSPGTSIARWNPCRDVLVFNRQQALWREFDGRFRALGMPVPRVLPGEFYSFRATRHHGVWWCCYQSTFNGHLVVHPFGAPEQGHTLNARYAAAQMETWVYRPDIVSVDGELRVVWAIREDESAPFIRLKRQRDFGPVVNLLETAPQPEPGPEPTPSEPEPTPMPAKLPDLKYLVVRVKERFEREHGFSGPFPSRALQGAFEYRLAQEINLLPRGNADGEIPPEYGRAGLHKKGGSNSYPIPGSNETVDGDLILFENGHMRDVLGSEETKGEPSWNDEGFTDRTDVYVSVSDSPVPSPEPEPGETHRYIGGGRDSGVCDECKRPRLDPVHRVPEGLVPHAYWGGEDGVGLCDLCLDQPKGAAIHQPPPLEPQPDPEPGPEPDPEPLPGPGPNLGPLLLRVVALLEEIRNNQAQQTAVLRDGLTALQKQVETGVRIKF